MSENIRRLFGVKKTDGDVGLEIECEGNAFRKSNLPAGWRYVHDGSLRGRDNAEYVFDGAKKFSQVPKLLDSLFEMFSVDGTVLDISIRTSVHVHLNFQNHHMDRLAAFLGLYFTVEEILTEFCGDHRVGNLFCLRGRDAPAVVSVFSRLVKTDGAAILTENYHYAGLNPYALGKYGSVEVRTFRGATDKIDILEWVSILRRIYDLAGDYPDPREVPSLLSSDGPEGFLRHVLGEHYRSVMSKVPFDYQEVRESLYRGVRLAQDICYCRDWSKFKRVEVKEDVFGRVKPAPTSLGVALSDLDTLLSFSMTPSPQPAPSSVDDEEEAPEESYDDGLDEYEE